MILPAGFFGGSGRRQLGGAGVYPDDARGIRVPDILQVSCRQQHSAQLLRFLTFRLCRPRRLRRP